MKIIYLRGDGEDSKLVASWLLGALFLGVAALFGLIMFLVGYQTGINDAEFPEHQLVSSLKRTFTEERQFLDDVKQDAQSGLDALAIRVGQFQSQLLRLNALGERLVAMGGLDKGEFSFENRPAMGGPDVEPSLNEPSALPDLLTEMDRLDRALEQRQQQLSLVEDLIMNTNLEDSVHPAGRPVEKGWISSYFGIRTDPFTGKRSMHRGIDFAGKNHSDVVAVAAGVVTWAAERGGYGNLIEINHGKGYATRYGHNSELLVEIGDRVKQGQVIAKLGSSGRSTGPHVHFEVLRKGKVIDPTKYILSKRDEG
ncbi:MAG: M23 family metallopeptidase [Candidatus Thiodiazotropha sp.]